MKYYIIAGEASGDLHGANLLKELLAKDSDAHIRYWGGDRMASVAMESGKGNDILQVRHIRDLAFMGIVEVVSHLGAVLGNIRFCKRDIMEYNPDVIVYIDYPSFNLKIAKFAHAQGFKNLHYISPQVWAWKRGRLRPMRRDLDRLCYILPMEQEFYKKNSMPQAVYVGHPLLDEVERYKTDRSGSANRGSVERKTIALLPGSRKQELGKMLPMMVRLAEVHKEYNFVVTGMSLIGDAYYRRFIPSESDNIEVVYDKTYDVLSEAYAAVVCSGTATLETALFGVPQVVCYQCNPLSAAIARRLIASRIKYISLVNLIADERIVSELIQDDFDFDRLESEFALITKDEANRQRIADGYDKVAGILGGAGASGRTADEVISIAAKQ